LRGGDRELGEGQYCRRKRGKLKEYMRGRSRGGHEEREMDEVQARMSSTKKTDYGENI